MPLFQTVLKMSLSAGVMTAAVLAVRPFVRRKLPCVTLSVIWGLVWCLFVLPMRPASPTSVYNFIREPETYNAIALNLNTSQAVNFPENTLPTWNLMSTLFCIWICGLLLTLMCFIWLNIKLYKRYKGAVRWDDNRVLALTKGLRRNIRIYTSNSINTPITYGLFSPKIILPHSLIHADTATFEYIVRHELQHIRHFDALMNVLWLGILCVHWFNPLAWASWIFFRKDIEFYCDTQVVKNIGLQHKSDYAQTLLDMTVTTNVSTLSLAFITSSTGARIRSIMSCRHTTPFAWFGMGALTFLLLIAFATNGLIPNSTATNAPAFNLSPTLAVNSKSNDFDYIYFDITQAIDDKVTYSNYHTFTNKVDLDSYLTENYGADIVKAVPNELVFTKNGFGINDITFLINAQNMGVNTEKGVRYFVIMDKASFDGDIPITSAISYLQNYSFTTNVIDELVTYLN